MIMKTLSLKKVTSVFAASVFSASIATAAFANPAADNTAEQGSVAEHVQMMHAGKKGMKGNQGGNLLTGKSLEQMKIILELSDDQVTQITAIMDTVKSDKKDSRADMKEQRSAIKAQLDSGEMTKEDIKALREAKKNRNENPKTGYQSTN
mgnify:CR=1 FL=1